MPSCKYMHMFMLLNEIICIHIWIHIQTCLFVKTNANELKCWRTGKKTASAGRWTVASSLGVSHYLSQTPSLVLDRSWTGTLPSSLMKNVHLTSKERGDDAGGGVYVVITPTSSNLLHMQAHRHIPRHTIWTSTHSAAKRLQAFNKDVHVRKNTQSESRPGVKGC